MGVRLTTRSAFAAFRQEMTRTFDAQQTKGIGWARRIIHSLTPGARAMNSARRILATFWESDSPDPSLLDTCINHFHKAGARRQHECQALVATCFVQAMFCYESGGHKQEDIERTLQTGNEARNLWSDRTNPGVYSVILCLLAMVHWYLYDQSIADAGSGGSSNLGAFDLAKEYLLEVINNKHVGDFRLHSRMVLGALIMRRCTHENTTSGLDTCIEHWEYALQELTDKRPASANETEPAFHRILKEREVLQRAGLTYRLGVAYQLQYREDIERDSRLHNLNTSIDYFEKAQVLFGEMENPPISLARITFSLATRLMLRGELTKERPDMDRAKELLKSAQMSGHVDEELTQEITTALTTVECDADRGH